MLLPSQYVLRYHGLKRSKVETQLVAPKWGIDFRTQLNTEYRIGKNTSSQVGNWFSFRAIPSCCLLKSKHLPFPYRYFPILVYLYLWTRAIVTQPPIRHPRNLFWKHAEKDRNPPHADTAGDAFVGRLHRSLEVHLAHLLGKLGLNLAISLLEAEICFLELLGWCVQASKLSPGGKAHRAAQGWPL